MFSPWRYDIDPAAKRLLSGTGWNAPEPDQFLTGAELYERYLEPLANRTPLAAHIRTGSPVVGVARKGFDKVQSRDRDTAPFDVRYLSDRGPQSLTADAVIDTTGTWHSPNPAGASGLPAIGENAAQDRIAYGMPDVLGGARSRYAGRRIAVVGAGHSAIGTLLDLARLKTEAPGTEILWLLRSADPARSFGGGAADQLAARSELGTAFRALIASGTVCVEAGFRIASIRAAGTGLAVVAEGGCAARSVAVDELIVATGFRPDLSFLSEVRLSLDPALDCPPVLAPLIDPNLHSCGTVRPHGARELAQPDAGLYIAGMKSYGRAPTLLLMTGYEQVRSIVAEIAGDRAAAAKVELVLPETGVCRAPTLAKVAVAASNCCGGPPAAPEAGCCVADVTAKAAGKSGCGCG